ncbi:LicD family-domain-containing protein, partial [Peziza echinospora]
YFKRVLSESERLSTLQNTMAAWLDWTGSIGIETWLAHGTLLGWWWNEKIFPWDQDIDVQVLYPTLEYLGQRYNMTIHEFLFTSGDEKDPSRYFVGKSYLLDVNHFIDKRSRGGGQNVIDARWIDTGTGLYIDITGLARMTSQEDGRIYYYCKNNHKYRPIEIYPLISTAFENMPAMAPRRYSEILIKEYEYKALWQEHFSNYHWNKSTKNWEKDELDSGSFLAGNHTVNQQPVSPLKLYRKIHLSDGGFWENLWRFFTYWF